MSAVLQNRVDPFCELLAGRALYHITPLHYLISVVTAGRLISAERGIHLGIAPRHTAARRDKMLGVNSYVHFYFKLFSPLLADKLQKGYPHCALVFDGWKLDAELGNRAALLPYNTKAWKSRADASPVHDRKQMASILTAHDTHGRFPGLEYLAHDYATLGCLRSILVFCERDYELAKAVITTFAPELSDILVHRVSHYYKPIGIEATEAYIKFCVQTRTVLKPPRIPFD